MKGMCIQAKFTMTESVKSEGNRELLLGEIRSCQRLQVRLLPPVPNIKTQIMKISDIDEFVEREHPYIVPYEEDYSVAFTKAELTSIYSIYSKRLDVYKRGMLTAKESNKRKLRRQIAKAESIINKIKRVMQANHPTSEDSNSKDPLNIG